MRVNKRKGMEDKLYTILAEKISEETAREFKRLWFYGKYDAGRNRWDSGKDYCSS